jgi:hypothetical protein
MTGTRNDRFAPGATLTRAMVAQILFNAYASALPYDVSEPYYQDVRPNVWYAGPVTWIGHSGLTDVPSGGNFRPGEPATREFVAGVLHKVSLALDAPLPTVREAAPFTDLQQITNAEAAQALQRAGVISGFTDGSFGPGRSITRAEMAAMIDRFTDLPGLAPIRE